MTPLSREQLDLVVHVAEVSEGSAIDYLSAAYASSDTERGAFLLLAHSQLVASLTLWSLALRDDKSFAERQDKADFNELAVRTELLGLVQHALALSHPDEPFPADENL